MTMASDEPCEEKSDVQNESRSSGAAEEEAVASKRGRSKNPRKRYPLVKYQDLPSHLKGNEFILDHYRCDWPLRETVLSLFSVHNETLNIWTHLVGFLIFLGLAFYTATLLPKLIELSALPSLTSFEVFMLVHLQVTGTWSKQVLVTYFALTYLDVPQKKERDLASALLPPESQITRWPFFVFLGGAMCCLLFSSTYHLLNCHSRRVHDVLHRLDHAGIAVLIAASFFPPIYYSFLCYPGLRNMYLVGITTISLTTIVFSSLESFRSHEFRKYRALLFFCTGASGIIPGAHRVVLYWNEPLAFECLWYEIAMGVLYGLGALLYAVRVPERLKPGRFDIVGHSHQIFHILVVLAALAHYKAGLLDMQWRESNGCPT